MPLTPLPHEITGRIRQASQAYLGRQEAAHQSDLDRKAREALTMLQAKIQETRDVRQGEQRSQELLQSRQYSLEDVAGEREYETEQDRIKREQEQELTQQLLGGGYTQGDVRVGGMTLQAPEKPELTFREEERIKGEVRSEQGVINLFQGTEKKSGYLDKVQFNNKEKSEAIYPLRRYNEIRKRQNLPELEFIKVSAGLPGPLGDYWALQEKTGQGGAVSESLGGGQGGQDKAVKFLQDNGAPVTQANIDAVKQKYGW